MSLIISVYTNSGIVMASDSRTSFHNTSNADGKVIMRFGIHHTDTTNKTFLCPNHIGISYCGDAIIDGQLVSSYMEHFIRENMTDSTKVTDVPEMLLNYFLEISTEINLVFQIAGYHQQVPYIYRVVLQTKFIQRLNEDLITGAAWDGETEYLIRHIKACYLMPEEEIKRVREISMTNEYGKVQLENVMMIEEKKTRYFPEANIPWGLFNLKDAIDFSIFAIQNTIDSMRFSMQPKTVGGPIDVLVIEPKDAYFVQKKDLYRKE